MSEELKQKIEKEKEKTETVMLRKHFIEETKEQLNKFSKKLGYKLTFRIDKSGSLLVREAFDIEELKQALNDLVSMYVTRKVEHQKLKWKIEELERKGVK